MLVDWVDWLVTAVGLIMRGWRGGMVIEEEEVGLTVEFIDYNWVY